jgi:hypothetical protein
MVGSLTNSWTEDPWIVQVALSTLDEEHLEVVIQVCQSFEVLGIEHHDEGEHY